MSVGVNTNTRDDFAGDGTSNAYPIDFPVFEYEFVEVYVIRNSDSVEFPLTATTHFTISNMDIYGQDSEITLINTADEWLDAGDLKTGYTLVVAVTSTSYQPAVLRELGRYALISVEKVLDRMALQIKRFFGLFNDEIERLDTRIDDVILLIASAAGLYIDSQLLGAGGQVLVDQVNGYRQMIKVASSGGAVVLNALPITGDPVDGQLIILLGTDNVNTVQINHNDSAAGIILAGDIILRSGDMLTLVYDASLDRYVETARSKK